jgi:hypothetical protein
MLGTNLCENKIQISLCGESQFDLELKWPNLVHLKKNGMWLQLQTLWSRQPNGKVYYIYLQI